ncbi:MAG: Na(+)/H(+) antiporter subunit D, partial [Gammaproteobacteria bacterium]|nr:Na(+)/H(+) antiporter subunit D [Gammaproteobacteria bacterium]NIV77012.1 Na(+)/H(+) antiporter subunit D [Gammaproteobacteria bacterium]
MDVPPFLIFYIAALLLPAVHGRARSLVLLGTPVVSALLMLSWNMGERMTLDIMGLSLSPVRIDALSRLFGILFHLAAFIGIVFALHVRDTVQHAASLVYAGSAIGAVFAGDLLTLFLFWEMLAVSSVFLIWARRTPRALASGLRYLIIQVVSGLLLLAGVLIGVSDGRGLEFDHIGLDGMASWLIFIAFGIKAGFPLLHNWLTDAYPEATPTGTVFLSAFTTKVAIYALARGFPGTELLVYIGAVMTCFPIFYAVIENDLRRVLAYSLINQLGFMVCGIGIGTALAINGAVAHAFNDVLFKGLLLMSMGAVLYRTGKINGSELGGLYKSMPKTAALCAVGAASISAFPLFSGFVSKSMVMTATLDEGHHWVWLMLLFASAGVFHHAGIKIPFFAFFSHDSGIRTEEAPRHMLIAMTLGAALCVGIGSYPWPLYALLPYAVDYSPFDATHVIAQLQLLFFSALAFTWLKLSGIYPPELPSVNIDSEWVYRRLAPRFVHAAVAATRRLDHVLRDALAEVAGRGAGLFGHSHGATGTMART